MIVEIIRRDDYFGDVQMAIAKIKNLKLINSINRTGLENKTNKVMRKYYV